MKLETIDSMLASADYNFELTSEWDSGEAGIYVEGDWIVDGERRHVNYSIADLYRDCGGEYPCAPCEGGLMVFDSETERDTWLNQR